METAPHSRWLDALDRECHIGSDALRVVDVSEMRVRDGQSTFSVVLELADPRRVEQGTYDVDLGDGAPVPVFLVPISEHRLEAVFNTMIEESA